MSLNELAQDLGFYYIDEQHRLRLAVANTQTSLEALLLVYTRMTVDSNQNNLSQWDDVQNP